jgi:hypothetical protein
VTALKDAFLGGHLTPRVSPEDIDRREKMVDEVVARMSAHDGEA